MPMILRSGRLTGTRGIIQDGRWTMYIKPSEQKEAQDMLRGKIPIFLDPREMITWFNDPNRDERPSPQDVALARTMCIASGGKAMRVSARRLPLYEIYLDLTLLCETTEELPLPISPHWINLSH